VALIYLVSRGLLRCARNPQDYPFATGFVAGGDNDAPEN
jgi:hypothetical protein